MQTWKAILITLLIILKLIRSWFMAHGYPWYSGLGFAHGIDRSNLVARGYLGLSGLDVAHGHLMNLNFEL